MMTPGQASRIPCWISRDPATSHDGRCPLFGSCRRRWMCMTLAPALKAALASRAICSGVTGTLCCFGSVSTPLSAQVMTALSLMDQPWVWTAAQRMLPIMRRALAGFLRQRATVGANTAAAVDGEIARAGKDRARHQPVKPSDRVAEMGGIGITDVLGEMRQIDVLIGEVQQMPRTLPGSERTERDSGLLLEQMQETRRRQPRLRRTACRRHRVAAEFSDLRDRAHDARVERARRQSLAKTHDVEFGIGNIIAM